MDYETRLWVSYSGILTALCLETRVSIFVIGKQLKNIFLELVEIFEFWGLTDHRHAYPPGRSKKLTILAAHAHCLSGA